MYNGVTHHKCKSSYCRIDRVDGAPCKIGQASVQQACRRQLTANVCDKRCRRVRRCGKCDVVNLQKTSAINVVEELGDVFDGKPSWETCDLETCELDSCTGACAAPVGATIMFKVLSSCILSLLH